MIDDNKKKNKRCGRVERHISSLLSLRSFLAPGVALALLAGIGTSCSSGMDDEAMTRTGAPMTVTATMQGVAKPAAAVSEVVFSDGTGLPATRTTTADDATAGVYTATWKKGDVVNVVFHCYSDADGATEIDAALMLNGNTQTLTYDGTTWTASPASLRLPAGVYSVKAVYVYSRSYTAAGDTPIDGTTIRTLMHRGTESIAGQSFIIAPDDITKTGIAIAPAADKWQRLTALVRLTSLAFGQSVRVTSASGESTLMSCPTMQTADPTQPANGALMATVYLHQSVDDPANPTAVTSVTVDGVSGVVKPAFHTEAGRLYSIYVPLLFGELGPGDEDGGQGQLYDTWSGTYAKFYNNGFGAYNIVKYANWNIDLSAESDKTTAVSFIKGKADARTTTVNIALTGIETIPDNAFKGCTLLASISLPTATSIGDGAFHQCNALTGISMPVATSIGELAFDHCSGLTSVSLPKATVIEGLAFNFCTALTSVSLPVAKDVTYYAFSYCETLTNVYMPVATTIGEGVFSQCNELTNVSLPAATSIGRGVFYSCLKLASVNLPAATSFGEIAFAGTPLTMLKLTAVGEFTLDAGTFNNYDKFGICTLTLNTDKQSGSVLPQASGNAWFGQTWKAILYE